VSIIEKTASPSEPNDPAGTPDPAPGSQTNGDASVMADAVPHANQVTIDLGKLRRQGLITPQDQRSRIAEEFRLIKRPLIQNAFNHSTGKTNKGNLIMVTSAVAGEGKSFCAVNLAMSIAMEMDHTVLLIDADVARPAIPDYLGIKGGKGLLDVLLDERIELADVILKTNVEKLSVLLSGTKNAHATELLASQNMQDLLADIAQRYQDRIIIFDSPPLLLTTESRVLATQMGQIVVVVASETTSQKAVMEALRQIESCHDVKLIYNQARAYTTKAQHHYY
jgi:protein-tyrosine kinase